MQSRDLFVKVLGQHIDFLAVISRIFPKLNLREHLVRERVRHDEARVTRCTAQVDEPTFGEKDDALAIWEDHVIDLRLDVFPLVLLQVSNVNFVVEMTDVADDGLTHQSGRHDSLPSKPAVH